MSMTGVWIVLAVLIGLALGVLLGGRILRTKRSGHDAVETRELVEWFRMRRK